MSLASDPFLAADKALEYGVDVVRLDDISGSVRFLDVAHTDDGRYAT